MTCLTAASLTSRLARGGTGLALFLVARRLFCQEKIFSSSSFPLLHFFTSPLLPPLAGPLITFATRGSPLDRFDRSHLSQLSKKISSRLRRRSFGRDEPLLHREAGSAVAGRQVAAAREKRDLQEVPVPARFLLKRAIPPCPLWPDCVLIVVAAPLSYSPHCASLRSGRLLKQPGAAR